MSDFKETKEIITDTLKIINDTIKTMGESIEETFSAENYVEAYKYGDSDLKEELSKGFEKGNPACVIPYVKDKVFVHIHNINKEYEEYKNKIKGDPVGFKTEFVESIIFHEVGHLISNLKMKLSYDAFEGNEMLQAAKESLATIEGLRLYKRCFREVHNIYSLYNSSNIATHLPEYTGQKINNQWTVKGAKFLNEVMIQYGECNSLEQVIENTIC